MKVGFEVFYLDVYMDDAGCWTENDRTPIGELVVNPTVGSDIDAVDVISAMNMFCYSDIIGRRIKALETSDRRVVYAEDYYGDGTWWEVGTVKGHTPVYGLKLKEDDEHDERRDLVRSVCW